jgi:hypothetical protein
VLIKLCAASVNQNGVALYTIVVSDSDLLSHLSQALVASVLALCSGRHVALVD